MDCCFHPAAHARQALTLLELLAVVVLLGLLGTALSATGLLRAQPRVALQSAVGVVHDLEHRLRMAAIGGGGQMRFLYREARGEVFWPPQAHGQYWSADLPTGVEIRLQINGLPVERLPFDARGRSADAEIFISGFGDELHQHISGLTGGWSEVRP